MVQGIDQIILAVADLESAVGEYASLLGPQTRRLRMGPDKVGFLLANTTLVLRQQSDNEGRIVGLVLADETAGDCEQALSNSRDLELWRLNPESTTSLRELHRPTRRVDHIVLRTADAEDCVSLFRDALGMRLALDQTVPEWGGRMLFFRSGKLTLEIIEAQDKRPEQDYFWGIAYECQDIEQEAGRLVAAGVNLSELRKGRKPGTRVATLKSHDLGVPTLLLQPASRG